MEWSELEATIRQKVAEQPRGFQARLGEALGVKQPSVTQALSGKKAFPREWVGKTLDMLGLEIVVRPKAQQ
ncbi:helix-turn-helix domain-containing protein [Deinococcus hopiensis]|nr:helix-turn-helix domain-containing protein [Deinococcus hopiensis]